MNLRNGTMFGVRARGRSRLIFYLKEKKIFFIYRTVKSTAIIRKSLNCSISDGLQHCVSAVTFSSGRLDFLSVYLESFAIPFFTKVEIIAAILKNL